MSEYKTAMSIVFILLGVVISNENLILAIPMILCGLGLARLRLTKRSADANRR